MNLHIQKDYLTILNKTIKKFSSEGKNIFYLEDLIREAGITEKQAEESLIYLLRKNSLEGRVEVICPRCGRDQGQYERFSQIPSELTCEICQYEFPAQIEAFQVVLEVKEEFFRKSTEKIENRINTISTKEELYSLLNASLSEKDGSKKVGNLRLFLKGL
jgi:hypothetical protein